MKIKLIGTLMCLAVLCSCSENETEFDNEIINVENGDMLKTQSESFRTNCNIEGDPCGLPGSTVTLHYNSDFAVNDVTWSVLSGNISITGGQGTRDVTLQLASNFNDGEVYAIGSGNNGVVCSDAFAISNCDPTCTPPSFIKVLQTSGECPGDIFTFEASHNGSTTEGTYEWSCTHGASVTSGQGTAWVTVLSSPTEGGFRITVTHVNSCEDKQVSHSRLALTVVDCPGYR